MWTICVVLLLVLNLAKHQVRAGKIDAYDLLIGDWNATIRCSRSVFTSELFPPRVAASDSILQARKGWDLPRNFECRLSLYPNGTFGLEPRSSGKLVETGATDVTPLSVHGRWTLDPNPYCVTDRFYDQVCLRSYPRVKKKRMDGREEQEQVVKENVFRIQCRLSGHFSRGKLPLFRSTSKPFYARGKLSHGVFIISDDNQQESHRGRTRARPKVAASFAARRQIRSRSDLESNL